MMAKILLKESASMKDSLRLVIKSFKNNPDDWKFGYHTLDNAKLDIEIWTSNGFWFCQPYNSGDNVTVWSLWEKFLVTLQIRKLKERQIINKFH